MDKLPKKDHELYIQEGIMEGLRVARTEGLKVGDLVYHPSDDCVYMLKSVEGDTATVCLPAGTIGNNSEITKKFPYKELINPKAALHGALKAKFKPKIEKAFPSTKNPNEIN